MASPTGLYGHVEANTRRSLLLFAMFAIAFQLLGAVSLFLPLLLFDPSHAPLFHTLAYVVHYVPVLSLFSAVLFAAQMWWFVGTVRKRTNFAYVDSVEEPRLCRILEPLAIAAGIRTPFAAVIETPTMNAFAAGVRDRHMVVVATRGLIDGLDDDELAGVLATAVVHIRNRDTRLLAAASIFMRNMTVLQRQKNVSLDKPLQVVPLVLFPVFLPLMIVVGFLGQIAFRLAYGSRALIGIARELIADAEAVRLTHNPAALVSALRHVDQHHALDGAGDELDAMLFVGSTTGPTATHPTLDERIGALARTTGSLVLDTAQRLDTRPLEQRRQLGFGRRADPSVERIALLAEEPERRGMWRAFRSVRDPGRNWTGLNRRGMGVVVASVIGIALLHRDTLAGPAPIATLFDGRQLRPFAGIGATVARCVLTVDQSESFSEQCEKDGRAAGRAFEHLPGFGPMANAG